MSVDSAHEVQGSDTEHGRLPRMTGVIVFRFLVMAFFCLPFLWFILGVAQVIPVDSASGPLILVGMLVAIVTGVPSLVIAIGLLKRRHWAGWLAVMYDSLWSPIFLAILISANSLSFSKVAFGILSQYMQSMLNILVGANRWDPREDILLALVIGALGVAFFMEGAYLLRKMKTRLFVWMMFGAVVAAILMVGLLPGWLQLRELRPLISYAETHWIEIPKGSRITFQHDAVDIHATNGNFAYIWHIKSTRGPWRLKGGHDRKKAATALMAGSPHSQDNPPESPDDALKLVRALGVTDPGLRRVADTKMFDRTAYCFWSPRARGTYAVPVGDGRIYLFLRDNVVVR